MAMACPPAASTAWAVSSPAAALISATQTLAPSRAKSSAAARPIPVPAPVMKATLPSNRAISAPDVSMPGRMPPAIPLSRNQGRPSQDGLDGLELLRPDRVGVAVAPLGEDQRRVLVEAAL